MGDWDIDNLDMEQAKAIVNDYIDYNNKNAKPEKIKLDETYQIGDFQLTTYSDGSYAIISPTENTYDFYPSTLAGWGYHTSDKKQHDKQVVTYLSESQSNNI